MGHTVHTDTREEVRVQSVNIGYVTCAKKEMTVNIFMSMTCQRCLHATSSRSLESVIIATASTCMLMLRHSRSKSVHGTIEVSASMVRQSPPSVCTSIL